MDSTDQPDLKAADSSATNDNAPGDGQGGYESGTSGNAFVRILGILLFGAIVGVVSASLALIFVTLIDVFADRLFASPDARQSSDVDNLLAWALLVPIVGGLATGLVVRLFAASGKAESPVDVIQASQARRGQMPLGSGIVSTLAAFISLSSGASAGKYGPLAHLGAYLGSFISKLVGVPMLAPVGLGCGIAAAIAAAFNAPIAGLVFAHEVVLRHYSLRAFAPITLASTMGYVMANYVFKTEPLFSIGELHIGHPAEYPVFALTGLVGALLAVVFMRTLARTRQLARATPLPEWLKPALAGLGLGLASLWLPQILGVGDAVIQTGIEQPQPSSELIVLLVAKLLATCLCLGFGFVGGVFSPALVMGVLLGGIAGNLVASFGVDTHSAVAVYAICAMAAVTSPVIGAPLTTILIVFELSGNYALTTAVMVAVVFSNVVSYRVFGRSWYDAELIERGFDLSLGRDRVILEEKRIADVVVEDYVRIDSFEPLETIHEMLLDSGRADAYIVNENGDYIGTITLNQLLRLESDELLSDQLAGDLAKPVSIILTVDDSIWEAMERIGHFVGETIPVIRSNEDTTLVGVVSESDIVRSYLDTVYELRREEHAAS